MRTIKCPNCGTYNTNKERCKDCNTVLSYQKRRALEVEKRKKEALEKEKELERQNPSFFDTYRSHRFWIVRALVSVIHSIWLGILAIGAFIAWLFTAIAA